MQFVAEFLTPCVWGYYPLDAWLGLVLVRLNLTFDTPCVCVAGITNLVSDLWFGQPK